MIPELTKEQRRENLEKAMKLRQERAAIRSNLKAGTMSIAQVIDLAKAGNRAAGGMRAKQMVNALPGYGLKRAQNLMAQIGIADTRRVGGLGSTQIEAIIAKLDGGKQ